MEHGGNKAHRLGEGGIAAVHVPFQMVAGSIGYRFSNQRTRLFRVISGYAQRLIIIGRTAAQESVHDLAVAMYHAIQNGLAIDAVQQRLTNAHIGDTRGIDENGLVRDGRTHVCRHVGQRLDALVVLQENVARGLLHQINLAGLQPRQQLCGIQHLNIQILDLRRTHPVIVVGNVMDIVIQVSLLHEVGAADDIRMVEPVIALQLILRHAAQHMLRQGQHIAAVVVAEGIQRHGPLGSHGQHLVADNLHAADLRRAALHHACVVRALNGVHRHAGVEALRTGHAQQGEGNVLRRHRLAVRPSGRILQLNGESQVILGGDGFRKLRHIFHVRAGLHQRQEHQRIGVLQYLCCIHQQRIQRADHVRHADIHRLGLFLCYCAAHQAQRHG